MSEQLKKFVINHKDIERMACVAKDNFFKASLPMEISKKTVVEGYLPTVMTIEAVLSYLNENKLLVELPEIEYTTNTKG